MSQDPIFWKSLWITVKCAMVAVPLGIAAGVGLALLLRTPRRSGVVAADAPRDAADAHAGDLLQSSTFWSWMFQFAPAFGGQWAQLMAGAALFTVPMIILFFVAQRTFIQGISTTGLKT